MLAWDGYGKSLLDRFSLRTSICYLCSYLKEIVIPDISFGIVYTQILRHLVVFVDAVATGFVGGDEEVKRGEGFKVGVMIV
jgi:hypothetical protein